MAKKNTLIVGVLVMIAASCSKIQQPEGYAPVITFSNYANNPVLIRPWIQNDTMVIGYPNQEFTVSFAAPNVLSEVGFSGPDTSAIIRKSFEKETRFNYQLNISVPCPDKTFIANWTFKASDRAGKSTERKVRVVYVDTFKIIPVFYNMRQTAFDLVQGKYSDPLDVSKAGTVDVEDTKSGKYYYKAYFGDYLSHSLTAAPQTGTKFVKAAGIDFSDMSINKAYLESQFIAPQDSATKLLRGDVIICKLRNTSDYGLLKIIKIDGTNNPGYYAPNYYIVAYRNVTE